MNWFVLCPAGNSFIAYSPLNIFFTVLTCFSIILMMYIVIKALDDGINKKLAYLSIIFIVITLILNIWLSNMNPYGGY